VRACYVTLPIIIISLIIFSGLLNFTYGQVNETTKIYQNDELGIKLSLPADWGTLVDYKGCHEQNYCSLTLNNTTTSYPFGLLLEKSSKEYCNCSSLMDAVKINYKLQSAFLNGFSFKDDNRTNVGKNYSGWKFEYSFLQNGKYFNGINLFAKSNDTYYTIRLAYPDESRGIVLPEFKKVIDSIEFFPISIHKTPSFMTASELEQSKHIQLSENTLNGLQILSHNSYTDSVGFMHVVGEVQNNSPTAATFVKVTGTFYNNNQVVGTQFTYTTPSDIGAGQKAPFDLILTSASVPISHIDHYNLVASSQ
jgi:hypothetical protein